MVVMSEFGPPSLLSVVLPVGGVQILYSPQPSPGMYGFECEATRIEAATQPCSRGREESPMFSRILLIFSVGFDSPTNSSSIFGLVFMHGRKSSRGSAMSPLLIPMQQACCTSFRRP